MTCLGAFVVNFEDMSYLFLVFLLFLSIQVNVCWVLRKTGDGNFHNFSSFYVFLHKDCKDQHLIIYGGLETYVSNLFEEICEFLLLSCQIQVSHVILTDFRVEGTSENRLALCNESLSSYSQSCMNINL